MENASEPVGVIPAATAAPDGGSPLPSAAPAAAQAGSATTQQDSRGALLSSPAQLVLVPDYGSERWELQRRQWTQQRADADGMANMQTPRAAKMTEWSQAMLDDMLLNSTPLPSPVPLAELVDILVDVWAEETY